MRLPKVLAVAVGAILLAGGGSALAIGSAPGHGRATGPAGVVGGRGRSAPDPASWAAAGGSPGTASPARGGTGAAGSGGVTTSTLPARSAGGAGLSVPAGGAPLSASEDPVGATVPSAPDAHRPAVSLPTPAAGALPSVPAPSHVVTPDAVVLLSAPLSAAQRQGLSKLRGVGQVEVVDSGTVSLGGAPVVALGVDPGAFRDITPPASASSDQLWQYLAAGSLVSSYSMAHDRSLNLGSTQTIVPGAASPDSTVKGWLGAFASIGLPGVDLLVAHQYSPDLGLTPNSGLVVSAPGLDGASLQAELQSVLSDGAVELLHPDQLPTDLPGNTLGSATRQKILATALSRVGLPYVWGGAGPGQFDCSGLVQWSYRQAGILMPRVAAQQFLTGDHIPVADAQPGDLLFWTYDPSDPGYVDHVGIYLGHGMMVVAPHTGTNVQVAPVPLTNFAGAVEVVLAK